MKICPGLPRCVISCPVARGWWWDVWKLWYHSLEMPWSNMANAFSSYRASLWFCTMITMSKKKMSQLTSHSSYKTIFTHRNANLAEAMLYALSLTLSNKSSNTMEAVAECTVHMALPCTLQRWSILLRIFLHCISWSRNHLSLHTNVWRFSIICVG